MFRHTLRYRGRRIVNAFLADTIIPRFMARFFRFFSAFLKAGAKSPRTDGLYGGNPYCAFFSFYTLTYPSSIAICPRMSLILAYAAVFPIPAIIAAPSTV